MGKRDGTDAHGPVGSPEPRGQTQEWFPVRERKLPTFDPELAEYHRELHRRLKEDS